MCTPENFAWHQSIAFTVPWRGTDKRKLKPQELKEYWQTSIVSLIWDAGDLRGQSAVFGQVIGSDNGRFLCANRISGKIFQYLPVVYTDCKRMNTIFTRKCLYSRQKWQLSGPITCPKISLRPRR